jgi:hypothetical protein
MDLTEALKKALHIFEEERVRPTLGYRYMSKEWPSEMKWEAHLRQKGYSPAMAAITGLGRMRSRRPREVEENPKAFIFESGNDDLLLLVFNQVAADSRPEFMSKLVEIMLDAAPTNNVGPQEIFPSWEGRTSSLSLFAEFCIRTGYGQELLKAASKLPLPLTGVAIMLVEIEEIIVLNFNLFSDKELETMPKVLAPLRETAELQAYGARVCGGAVLRLPIRLKNRGTTRQEKRSSRP